MHCAAHKTILFTAECKTIMLEYHLISNIQYGSQKPEVLITSLLLQIETPFQSRNGIIKLAVCTRHLLTAGDSNTCWICKMVGN